MGPCTSLPFFYFRSCSLTALSAILALTLGCGAIGCLALLGTLRAGVARKRS
jgi:hypothetical protein